ncbi:MAG: hypothetical protein JNK05_07285 [Myxococcales bacterium]|nr:hypothetical protein [Myxococcales bacterium]
MRSHTIFALVVALSASLVAPRANAQSALSDEVAVADFVTGAVAPSILALRDRDARILGADFFGDLDGDGTRDFLATIGREARAAYFAVLRVGSGYCATPIAYWRTRQWCWLGPSDTYPMFVRSLRVGSQTYVAVRTVGRENSSKTDYALMSVVRCGHIVERYREALDDGSYEFVVRRGLIELRSGRRVARVLRLDAAGERMVDVRAARAARR